LQVAAEVSWIDETYRGLVATQNIAKGAVIAAIPMDVVYSLDKNDNFELEVSTLVLDK
jgi:hypothetical protein